MLSGRCLRWALEEDKSLCQGDIIVPYYPSTCTSAASAWGNQNSISID